MYFPESEAIACKHPDLQRVVELVDEQLSRIFSPAPLRPTDFACIIGSDVNQVDSVFTLLAEKGLLQCEEVVECKECHTLMVAGAFRLAVEDEDDFECTGCHRLLTKWSKPIIVYRMIARVASRPRPKAPEATHPITSIDEPLGERAQSVLMAMLELGAIDSDKRRSTEKIAVRALGANTDANSLKNVMAELNTRQLIKTKTGRGGGCWLTKNGQSRAAKLRSR